MGKLSKANQAMADDMVEDMEAWELKDWAAFNRLIASEKASVDNYEWHKAAYVTYMQAHAMVYTQPAGGYQATLTERKGVIYVDYASLLDELKEDGYDVDDLIKRHTHKRADTVAFAIKQAKKKKK